MVNKEEVRMLVQDVGYQLASQKTGIKEATLRQWAKRGQWNKPRQHAQAIVTTVTKPADAQLAILNERKDKSKLHLSKYVVEAGEVAANSGGKLSISGRVKDVASIHTTLWPEKDEEGAGTLSGLRVYSKQTVIAVQGRNPEAIE